MCFNERKMNASRSENSATSAEKGPTYESLSSQQKSRSWEMSGLIRVTVSCSSAGITQIRCNGRWQH